MSNPPLPFTPQQTAYLKCSFSLYHYTSLCRHFWSCHPALFYSLAALLGVFATAYSPFFPILIGALLVLPHSPNKKTLLFALIALAFYGYSFPANVLFPEKGVTGQGFLEIVSIAQGEKYHRPSWKYGALLHTFTSKEGITYQTTRLPIYFTLPQRTERLHGNGYYQFYGTVQKTRKGFLILKPKEIETWKLVDNTLSLGEIRYNVKEHIKSYLKTFFPKQKVATFMTGLATGDFQDVEMVQELSRFGLQHIMAISGFHFAILTAILTTLVGLCLSRRQTAIFLLFLLSCYFMLIGMRPSIFRAWLGISLYLVSTLIRRQSSPLNNLGCALFLLLVIDPQSAFNIGCQLSFLATGAILLFYQPCHNAVSLFLKKRKLSQAIQMPQIDQHAYLVLSFFRSGLALALAVNGVLFPCLLYLFHQFPLLGLIYNLFFPFVVSVMIFLLIIGTCLHLLIPPLGLMIHGINHNLTEGLLSIVYDVPSSFDIMLIVPAPSIEILGIFLVIMLYLGIYLYRKQEKEWVI